VGVIAQLFPNGHYFHKRVGGVALHAKLAFGPFDYLFRYVTALHHFDIDDILFQKAPDQMCGAMPSAGLFKAGYVFKVKGKETKLKEHFIPQHYNIFRLIASRPATEFIYLNKLFCFLKPHEIMIIRSNMAVSMKITMWLADV
jgi:hypothetical protein